MFSNIDIMIFLEEPALNDVLEETTWENRDSFWLRLHDRYMQQTNVEQLIIRAARRKFNDLEFWNDFVMERFPYVFVLNDVHYFTIVDIKSNKILFCDVHENKMITDLNYEFLKYMKDTTPHTPSSWKDKPMKKRFRTL